MTSFADIVAYLIDLLNQAVFVLAALAVVIFLWGVFNYIRQAASAKKPNRELILWSLLTLFVLFSIWGILRLMCNSFGLCTATTSNAPTNIVPAGGAWNY